MATNKATISNMPAPGGAVQFKLAGANTTPIVVSATVSNVKRSVCGRPGYQCTKRIYRHYRCGGQKPGNLVLSNTTGDDIKIQNMSGAAQGLTGASIKGADSATSTVFMDVGGTVAAGTDVGVVIGGQVSLNSAKSFYFVE